MKHCIIVFTLFLSSQVFSQSNAALSLSGTNESVNIGAPISSGSSYTKEAWVNPTFTTNAHNIISSLNAPFWISAGKLQGGHAGNYSVVTDPGTIPLNTWTHVAITYDASTGSLKLFRNGNLVASATFASTYTAETTYIGSHQGAASYYQGKLDEIRFWNRALTQQEIRKNMYKGPAVNATGLVQYFKCNQSSTGQLANSVAGQSSGTITGGSFVNSPVQFSANGLHFDGVNDYVEVPTNPSFNVSVATIECWMKPTAAVAGNNVLVGIRTTNSTRVSAHVNVYENQIGVWNGSAYNWILYNFTIGQWYHLAYVVKATNTDVYVNGNFAGTISSGMGTAANLPLRIGHAEPNMEYFNGVIDEVRLWNYNRSAAQIQANMNKELDPQNATEVNGLIAYYTFDQGIADGNNAAMTSVVDQIAGNNGTLYNAALSGTTSNYVAQNPVMGVLPIKLKSFSLNKNENHVLVNWTIDNPEKGSFSIEHSTNGQTFESIGEIGADEYRRSYTYSDQHPSSGKNFYRLKFAPLNGKIIYTDVKLINFESTAAKIKLLRVNGTALTLQSIEPSSILIISGAGEVIVRQKIHPGIHTLELGNVAKGIYFLKTDGLSQKILIK